MWVLDSCNYSNKKKKFFQSVINHLTVTLLKIVCCFSPAWASFRPLTQLAFPRRAPLHCWPVEDRVIQARQKEITNRNSVWTRKYVMCVQPFLFLCFISGFLRFLHDLKPKENGACTLFFKVAIGLVIIHTFFVAKTGFKAKAIAN
jgi:hypothetical protein